LKWKKDLKELQQGLSRVINVKRIDNREVQKTAWTPTEEMLYDFIVSYPSTEVFQRRIKAIVLVALVSLCRGESLFSLLNNTTDVAFSEKTGEIYFKLWKTKTNQEGKFDHFFYIIPNKVYPQLCFVNVVLDYMKDLSKVKKSTGLDFFWKPLSSNKKKV